MNLGVRRVCKICRNRVPGVIFDQSAHFLGTKHRRDDVLFILNVWMIFGLKPRPLRIEVSNTWITFAPKAKMFCQKVFFLFFYFFIFFIIVRCVGIKSSVESIRCRRLFWITLLSECLLWVPGSEWVRFWGVLNQRDLFMRLSPEMNICIISQGPLLSV